MFHLYLQVHNGLSHDVPKERNATSKESPSRKKAWSERHIADTGKLGYF